MPRIEAPTVAEHSAMRRRQVVQGAMEVLAARGAAGLNPAAVAKKAGIARSSIYQYYPSTDALLGAAVVAMLERARDGVLAAMSGETTAAGRVRAYVRHAFDDVEAGHGTLPADLAAL